MLAFAALTAVCALMLAGCGGGTTSVTTITGGGITGGTAGGEVALANPPTGPNTTEIVVDSGPASGFALGVANVPYVTVTICTPGSATDCATIDHVFLDTGSVGLRVLKSAVAGLSLPAVAVVADAATNTPAGNAAECYPFVLGAIWGPMATADVRIAGESAPSLPIQIIDDSTTPAYAAPADCLAAANGGLLTSVATLQANGVLGVGMTAFDCGADCVDGLPLSGHDVYYSCPASGSAACLPAAMPIDAQAQHPVAHFAANSDGTVDNNGTMIMMPALPDLGATLARGRLVFGIGTQANNQLPVTAQIYAVETDPNSLSYQYLATDLDGAAYPYSYIDSGSNALFFDDPTLPFGCQSSAGGTGGWFCPTTVARRTATITGATLGTVPGSIGQVDFAIANADALFTTSGSAFATLGGSAGQGAGTFVWGFPFFYGRTVFTSIWGQATAVNGPWNAF